MNEGGVKPGPHISLWHAAGVAGLETQEALFEVEKE